MDVHTEREEAARVLNCIKCTQRCSIKHCYVIAYNKANIILSNNFSSRIREDEQSCTVAIQ